MRANLGNLLGGSTKDCRMFGKRENWKGNSQTKCNLGDFPKVLSCPSLWLPLPTLRKMGLSFSTIFLFTVSCTGQRLALTLLSGGGERWSHLVPCIYEQLVQLHLRDLIN